MSGKPKINLVGEKFGKLTVIKKSHIKTKNNQAKWICLCVCGVEKTIMGQSLTRGDIKSCGCTQYKRSKSPPNLINLLGQKFGKLTVIGQTPSKNKLARWLCSCECGNTKITTGSALRQGKTKSCGCLKKIRYNWTGFGEINGTHWSQIKRHAVSKNRSFNITIQQAWQIFLSQDRKCALSGVPLTFSRSHRHSKTNQTASLDRIDSSKGYVIENVQWVHKEINVMKNIMPESKFLEWCRNIANYQSSFSSSPYPY